MHLSTSSALLYLLPIHAVVNVLNAAAPDRVHVSPQQFFPRDSFFTAMALLPTVLCLTCCCGERTSSEELPSLPHVLGIHWILWR